MDDFGRSTRSQFLRAAGVGALGTVAAGGFAGTGVGGRLLTGEARAATTTLSLVATDGYMSLPNQELRPRAAEGEPLYIFGFVEDPTKSTDVSQLINTYKGRTKTSAPTLGFLQNDDVKITLTNLGLIQRPDLTDSHTIHWHGFDIPSPLNDGVPEVSVAVPIGKQLTYFYRPHREGTYMWHCHFEDVEHVQMGMQGIVFVRPTQDGTSKTFGLKTYTKFAYNDGNGSTGYDRHFAILLDEIWSTFHDGDRDIQESIPTDYDPQWFTLNGRCYPQTAWPNDSGSLDPSLRIGTENTTLGGTDYSQPNSSLIQANGGERVLLRLANLGYQQHAMQLPGIPMHVVGQDASWLGKVVDKTYWTDTLYLGPGEARDVLLDAPAFDASTAETDPLIRPGKSFNRYFFKNRDWRKLSNYGAPGPGGMMTEVRVYDEGLAPADRLPAQSKVSETYV
jgi:FtsP/CotA-like multicopper oxidase with cupredoxin domain